MGRKLLLIILLLIAGFFRLKAQDIPVSVLDGPVLKIDTLSKKLPLDFPLITDPGLPSIRMPNTLGLPSEFETKEQRAARINAQTYADVMSSVDDGLSWYRPPELSPVVKGLFSVLKLFLTSPYKFQDGYVPVMSASNPFMAIKTPGGAPYENPYSPDKFPQAVRMEYDTATGTYKPVMVDWKEYQKQLDVRYNIPIENRPIPKVPLAPGDRIVP